MGERQSDSELTGRRRVHPADPAPGAEFEALLAATLREQHVDGEAERRAVHAFRAARDAGAHRARTRRRDDWRPRGRRGGARSLKTALSVLLAGFTLGGVAYAAIGGVGDASQDSRDERRPAGPSATGSPRQGAGSAAPEPSAASGPPDRPVTARDTEAHCRAYEQVEDRGKTLEAAVWRRLVDAAGGEEKVAGYCDRKLTETGPRTGPGDANAPAAPDISGTPDTSTVKSPPNPTGAAGATPSVPAKGDTAEDGADSGGSRPDAGRND